MKKRHTLALILLLLFLITGCSDGLVNTQTIPVGIQLSPGITVENNGLNIRPGEDAVFYLQLDAGLALKETDYSGEYRITLENGKIKLTLKNVRYPSRVAVQVMDSFVTITYDPNGEGEQHTIAYDISLRSRPNTAIGSDLYSREGYTLVSWNTRQDGTGQRIGLGSRVTVPGKELTLYAQWEKWSDASDFDWTVQDGRLSLTGYHGSDEKVVIPATVNGKPVTRIAAGAFQMAKMKEVVLPNTLQVVEDRAFYSCTLETLTLFDNIEKIRDASFERCTMLKTLRINAVEKPYGTAYRRESCYADKIDLLLQARGQKKMVFYGGCSMWYNLDSQQLSALEDQGYIPINVAINGTCNSYLQMQIIGHFLEEGDIFFHTPEISSQHQMMMVQRMEIDEDDKLWIGLEYNYDLVTLLDISRLPGFITSFCDYLDMKKGETSYNSIFRDGNHVYMGRYGCADFYREETVHEVLPDDVRLDTSYVNDRSMKNLQAFYAQYQAMGVRIYVSYACLNMDAVPEEERNSYDVVEERFRVAFEAMPGVALISRMEDYIYHNRDYYDSNYHLTTSALRRNTQKWLRDLQAQMERDGLWEAK